MADFEKMEAAKVDEVADFAKRGRFWLKSAEVADFAKRGRLGLGSG